MNLGGIYIYLPFYIPYIDISATGSLNIVDISAENLVSGTFARYNSLANFLTTIFLFISLEYYNFYKNILFIKCCNIGNNCFDRCKNITRPFFSYIFNMLYLLYKRTF